MAKSFISFRVIAISVVFILTINNATCLDDFKIELGSNYLNDQTYFKITI